MPDGVAGAQSIMAAPYADAMRDNVIGQSDDTLPMYRLSVRASFPAPYGSVCTKPIAMDGLFALWGWAALGNLQGQFGGFGCRVR